MARSRPRITVQPWDDFPYWLVDVWEQDAAMGMAFDPFGTSEVALRRYRQERLEEARLEEAQWVDASEFSVEQEREMR